MAEVTRFKSLIKPGIVMAYELHLLCWRCASWLIRRLGLAKA